MNDADIEMNELIVQGNRIARLKKKGICLHGWRQDLPDGKTKCLDCGKVASWEQLDEERNMYL